MQNYLHTRKQSLPIKLTLTFVLLHIIVAEGLRFESLYEYDKFPESPVHVDEKSLVSPGLVYGSCEIVSREESKTPCLFAMETNSNVGSPEHVRYCNITFDTLPDDRYDRTLKGRFSSIVAIDEDKAAIGIQYLDHSDLLILHFSDCRVVTVNAAVRQHLTVEAPLDGIFDAVSWDDRTAETFRTVLDFEGNVIVEKRLDWVEESSYYYFVLQSPLKGRLLVRKWSEHIQLIAVNDDGLSELLKEYPIRWTHWNSKYTISPTYQLLSICTENNSTVVCGQFDLNGVLKFETSLTVPDQSSKSFALKAHNLPGGGLLLLIFKCSYIPLHECTNNKNAEDYFIVTKFDGIGREVGSLNITQFPTINSYDIEGFHSFENEKKEMCLSLLANHFEDNFGPDTLDVACFKEEDLSLSLNEML